MERKKGEGDQMNYVQYRYKHNDYFYFVRFETLELAYDFINSHSTNINVQYIGHLDREPTREELSPKKGKK
jgi:hypothetical protein